MSLEYITLEKCVSQLETAFGVNLNEIASHLFQWGVIADDIYEEVVEPQSSYSKDDKTTKLMLQVMKKVKVESSYYYKLINHLRHDMKKYGDIVDVLDAEYFGIRKLPAPKLQRGIIISYF